MNNIFNKLQQIQNNINRNIQPIQDKINNMHIRAQPLYDLVESSAYKDTNLNDKEKNKALQETLETIIKLKNNPYLNSTHDEEKKKHQIYFITLLQHINKNHLNEHGHYRYVIDLFEKKEAMSKYLKNIRKDKDEFINLRKKYNLLTSSEMENVISFTSIIGEPQIIPLLFMFEMNDDLDDNNKALKSIFSILFYDKKMQYTFFKNIDDLEKRLEETSITFFEKIQTDLYL